MKRKIKAKVLRGAAGGWGDERKSPDEDRLLLFGWIDRLLQADRGTTSVDPRINIARQRVLIYIVAGFKSNPSRPAQSPPYAVLFT